MNGLIFLLLLFINTHIEGASEAGSFLPYDESVIRSWVNPAIIDKKGIAEITACLEAEAYGAEDSIRSIVNNPGDTTYYGKSFHSLWQIQLPFLQECAALTVKRSDKIGIELACADGKVIWKALSTGMQMYAVDQSTAELEFLRKKVEARVAEASSTLTVLPLSCFDILSQNPQLEGSFHVLYSQNLIHFFSVNQCAAFAELVYRLLAPEGTAYITANTLPKGEKETLALYTRSKAERTAFPGHMVHHIEKSYVKEKLLCSKVVSVEMAKPHETGCYELVSEEHGVTTKKCFRCVSNVFDTETLTGLFTTFGLELVDQFYMDESGMRRSAAMDEDSVFVSVILRKRL